MEIIINFKWDDEAEVWVATNEQLGIALESGSYDALLEKVKSAVPEMIELNGLSDVQSIKVMTDSRQVTYA